MLLRHASIYQPRDSLLVISGLYGRLLFGLISESVRTGHALISGGVGFITSTNGGNTTYIPVISPLLAAPLGDHLLVESRATILELVFSQGKRTTGIHQFFFPWSLVSAVGLPRERRI